jgi:hypothetical protein
MKTFSIHPGGHEHPADGLRQAGAMSLLHCPLCISLAILSVLRATSHLVMVHQHLKRLPAV